MDGYPVTQDVTGVAFIGGGFGRIGMTVARLARACAGGFPGPPVSLLAPHVDAVASDTSRKVTRSGA